MRHCCVIVNGIWSCRLILNKVTSIWIQPIWAMSYETLSCLNDRLIDVVISVTSWCVSLRHSYLWYCCLSFKNWFFFVWQRLFWNIEWNIRILFISRGEIIWKIRNFYWVAMFCWCSVWFFETSLMLFWCKRNWSELSINSHISVGRWNLITLYYF